MDHTTWQGQLRAAPTLALVKALATTAASISVENSSCGEKAINWTLPSKKAASPGRSDRDLTPCSRSWGGGVAAATESRVRSAPSTAFYAQVVATAASFSALSASSMSRCIW